MFKKVQKRPNMDKTGQKGGERQKMAKNGYAKKFSQRLQLPCIIQGDKWHPLVCAVIPPHHVHMGSAGGAGG